MKTQIIPIFFALSLSGFSYGAIIAQYDFTEGSLEATTVASGFTASDLVLERGTGSNPGEFLSGANDQRQWSARSFQSNSSQWFEFTITPGALTEPYTPQTITFVNGAFTNLGGNSRANFTVYSSLDGFTSVLDTQDGPSATSATGALSELLTLDVSSLGIQTDPLTLRIVMTNIGGTNGTVNQRRGFIDNVTLSGTIPEPTSALLGSLGILTLLRRRR